MEARNSSIKSLILIGLLIFLANFIFIPKTIAFKTHDMTYNPSLSELFDSVKKLVETGVADDVLRTHVWLTYQAIKLYEDYYHDTLTDEEKEFILIGCIEEDFDVKGSSPVSTYNHVDWSDRLYEKVNLELPMDKGFVQSTRCENHFEPKLNNGTGVDTINNVSAWQWAYSSSRNNCDWMDALTAKNDIATRAKIIGHILHLLEDMMSPAHVRNYNHSIKEDFYEKELGKIIFAKYSSTEIFSGLRMPQVALCPGSDLNYGFTITREYFASHFFSNHTLFKDFWGVTLPHILISNFSFQEGEDWFILNTYGQIVAKYDREKINQASYNGKFYFPTTYQEAQELADQGYIIMAGYEDLWKAVVEIGIPYLAGTIKLYKDITTNDIGYFADGWHSDGTSYAFVKCYYDNGGAEKIGYPFDNGKGKCVHSLDGTTYNFGNTVATASFWVQEYIKDGHIFMLVYNADLKQAIPVHGRVLDKWLCNSAYKTYKAPTENEVFKTRINGDQLTFQSFQNGQIIYDTKTGEYVDDLKEVLNNAPVQAAIISGPTATPIATNPTSDNSGIVLVPSDEYIAKINRNSTGTWYDRDGYMIDKMSYSQFSTLNGQAQIDWAEGMGFSQDPTAYLRNTETFPANAEHQAPSNHITETIAYDGVPAMSIVSRCNKEQNGQLVPVNGTEVQLYFQKYLGRTASSTDVQNWQGSSFRDFITFIENNQNEIPVATEAELSAANTVLPIAESANSQVKTIRIYAEESDGSMESNSYPGSWDKQRSDQIGRCLSYTGETASIGFGAYHFGNGYMWIDRAFFLFNTTVIPANANLLSVKFSAVVKECMYSTHDNCSYTGITTASQANEDELKTSDFGKVGNEKLASLYFSELPAGARKEWVFNSDGLAAISKTGYTNLCLREGHDLENNTENISQWNSNNWGSKNHVYLYTSEAGEAKAPYLEIIYTCDELAPTDQAVQNFLNTGFENTQTASSSPSNAVAVPVNTNIVQTETAAAAPTEYVLQLGPESAKDIWTTSVYSYTGKGGGPGGGLDNHELRVGGWGDLYYALLQFDLTNMPTSAKSAKLYLYNAADQGSPTAMYLDMITRSWDWDRNDRLWWKDKPTFMQILTIPAPQVNAWCEIDITDLYNQWQNGTYQNYGLQLRPLNANNNWNEFYSSDNADVEKRPKIVVTALNTNIVQRETAAVIPEAVPHLITKTEKFYVDPKGDAYAQSAPYPASWSDQHSSLVGRNFGNKGPTSSTGVLAYLISSGYFAIDRTYIAVDTSAIPDDAEIQGVKLSLVMSEVACNTNDAYSYIGVSSATRNNPEEIIATDFSKVGTEKFACKFFSDLHAGERTEFVFDAAGRNYISKTGWTDFCLREGHDLENNTTSISSWNYYDWSKKNVAIIHTSEANDAANRPYLEIIYSYMGLE